MGDGTTIQLQHWIDRMNAGDPAAREVLVAHAGDRLRRLARKIFHQDFRRVRAFEETDDVLQNALMRLLSALQAVPVASVAELFRLATLQIRRELLDLARKYPAAGTGRAAFPQERYHSDNTPSVLRGDPSDSTFEPVKLAFWQDFHERVERLPETERAVFELLWYQELTQGEAAAVLGVSVPTVKRRWLRARLTLKDFLKEEVAGP
jgi:RNA polymerase sigma-70 factor (ECF subfamily)